MTTKRSARAFRVPHNSRNAMDGLVMLGLLRSEEAKLAFFDPQYRGLLDQMKYGNEGGKQKARAALPQMTDDVIARFIEQIARTLKPSGHLMLWTDKHAVGSGHHLRYLKRAPTLHIVDLIHWHKRKFGMGYRSRGTSEYLLVLQKYPKRARGVWRDKSIVDSWMESADPAQHPHAKPLALIERLIRATTEAGDIVIDPAAGGFGVLDICLRTKRTFIGCDVLGGGDAA